MISATTASVASDVRDVSTPELELIHLDQLIEGCELLSMCATRCDEREDSLALCQYYVTRMFVSGSFFFYFFFLFFPQFFIVMFF